MSELIQWIIAGLIVVISAIYLIRRLARKTNAECCNKCSNCDISTEITKDCKD